VQPKKLAYRPRDWTGTALHRWSRSDLEAGGEFRVLLEHRINHLCVELYSRAFLQPSRERLRRGLVGERYFPTSLPLDVEGNPELGDHEPIRAM